MTRKQELNRTTGSGSLALWRRAVAVFEEAMDLEEDQLATFLALECGGDAVLRSNVERLLDHDRRPSTIPTESFPARALGILRDASIDQQIGSYRVLCELGAGGMGTVYLAERTDGEFDQMVAVKVLAHGVNRERFRVERQILARLTHPHIARLLDGGTLVDGRPFVAMEYVEGETLGRACDLGDLTVSERLKLMIQLCQAVRHAHQNLVVHRDLKPNNVMVDGEGQVKLLDFGIAKLVDDPAAETATAMRRMTPSYASPEQLLGLPVNTTSDVYSLGVVLYELLCGSRPFQHHETTPGEFEEAIRTQVPTPPSNRILSLDDDEGRRLAAHRGTVPGRLARLLRGDLDRMVLQTLHVDPKRRYQSAQQLLDDLERFLDGRPVAARGASSWYRFGKFIRRHRVAASVTLIVLALGATQQARILHERAVASQERDIARNERDTARATKDFLVELFAVSDPGEARGSSVTAREILNRGVERISTRFEDQPHVRAEMMATMGEVHYKLGLYEPATRILKQALELRRRAFGDVSQEVAESLYLLATLYYHRGEYSAALPLAEEALEVGRSLLAEDHVLESESLDLLAILHMHQGELDAAEPLFQRSLALSRALGKHSDVAVTLNNLAGLKKRQGELAAAESLYEESLVINRSLHEEPHPEIANGLNNLSILQLDRGNHESGLNLLREALAMRRAVFGDVHPDIAVTLTNLGTALEDTDPEEAAVLLREALTMRQSLLGDRHPQVGVTMSNLAKVLRIQGDAKGAETYYRGALAIWGEALGEDHWFLAVGKEGLAKAVAQQGRCAAAVKLAKEAVELFEKTLGPDHSRVSPALATLGLCLIEFGRFEEAEPYLLESHQIALAGGIEVKIQNTRRNLYLLYEALGDVENAARFRD